jgi:hypothetical protein
LNGVKHYILVYHSDSKTLAVRFLGILGLILQNEVCLNNVKSSFPVFANKINSVHRTASLIDESKRNKEGGSAQASNAMHSDSFFTSGA